MSIERTTELVAKGMLLLDEALAEIGVVTHDEHDPTEDFKGIVVSARSSGIVTRSVSGARSRRIENIDVMISIRSLVPDLNADEVGETWLAINEAILNAQCPEGQTWPEAIPALQLTSFFKPQGETSSNREDSEKGDRREHTRTYRFWVALR